MDQSRIDAIARAMAVAGSRRRALVTLLGAATSAGVALPDDLGAKNRKSKGQDGGANRRREECADGESRCKRRCCAADQRCANGKCVERDESNPDSDVVDGENGDGRSVGSGRGKGNRTSGRKGRGKRKGNGRKEGRQRNRDKVHDRAEPITEDEPSGDVPGDALDPGAGDGETPDGSGQTPDDGEQAPDDGAVDDVCIPAGEPCDADVPCCDGKCADGVCVDRGAKPDEDAADADAAAALAAPSTAPGAADSVLLKLYNHRSNGGINYARVVYRPRQFRAGLSVTDSTRGNLRVDDAGPYDGWDVLTTYNWSVQRVANRPDWLELELNRPATVSIVWRGGTSTPSWLRGWTKSSNVKISGKTFPTYQNSLPAGNHNLGAVYGANENPGVTRDTYWVLFAERDGQPSPEPTVQGGRERPQPNETCPRWVHDQYQIAGHDGKQYATWHAQIDPVYWCYHRHEHGSDPAAFHQSDRPLYGYSASAMGMTETHEGFKTYVMDDQAGNRWMITQHFGTAGLARACNRFHTFDIAVRRRSNGELLADLHLSADYGKAVSNRTDRVLTPPTCRNQGTDASGSAGVRKIPVSSDGFVGYEPWRFDSRDNILGLSGSITINTPDPIVICNTPSCDQATTTNNTGTKRFLTPNEGFRIRGNGNTGEFYTDAMGKRRMNSGQAGAVRQYVRAGVDLTLILGGSGGHYRDMEAWGRPYVYTSAEGNPTAREGSIQPPN